MKKVLALILALLMVFGMVACGNSDGGTKKDEELNTERMAEKFAEGLFTPDVEIIFDMMPFEPAMDQLDADDREAAEEELQQQIDTTQEILESQYEGVDFDWSIEVLEEEELSGSEMEELNEFYEGGDLTVDEAVRAQTEITITSDGEEETQPLELVFVKIDGEWYLDMNCISSLGF